MENTNENQIENPQQLNDLLQIRHDKLNELREKGKDPFEITKAEVTHHSKEIKENFEEFRRKVYEAVREIHITRFPYNNFLYPDFDHLIENEEDN